MEDVFSIDVEYNGEMRSFNVQLATTGYTHNFIVIINSIEVTYEPDEERNYRAIVNAEIAHGLKDKEKALIGLVGAKLDELKYL